MIEIANSIQSFPSTRAYSTSFSAGKYSGKGIGSEKTKKEMKFNLILYFQFTESYFFYSVFTSGQRCCRKIILNGCLSGFIFCRYFQLVPTSTFEITKNEIVFVCVGTGRIR